MNNKGFAVTGILYSILVLFLVLLLLILGNFHSRKVAFDKQKNSVLEKLEGVEFENIFSDFCYTNENELQEFITPSDGVYKLEVYSSNDGNYVAGEVRLYQGIKLFVLIGKDDNASNIRTESNKINTIILSSSNTEVYVYNDDVDEIEDITIGKISNENSSSSRTQNVCENSGYIKISRISN